MKFAGYTIAELLALVDAANATPGAASFSNSEYSQLWTAARNALRPLIEHIQLLTGAMAADDARDLAATNRLGLPPAGCDTPEVLADEIEALRARNEAQAKQLSEHISAMLDSREEIEALRTRVTELQADLASERGKA